MDYSLPGGRTKARFAGIYNFTRLQAAALKVYTKPLFNRWKAMGTSSDGRTLFDFARKGHRNLEVLHRQILSGEFEFRPARAQHFRFNLKERTVYLFPWEERIVDCLLFRELTRYFDAVMSPSSYAYRHTGLGVDLCQRRLSGALKEAGAATLWIVKRDIKDYFASVDHDLLLGALTHWVDPSDRLYSLLASRIRFSYIEEKGGPVLQAQKGIPFGSAVSCFFANLYLSALDRKLATVNGIKFFRYADDLLIVGIHQKAAEEARLILEEGFSALHLESKPAAELDLIMGDEPGAKNVSFTSATKFRHLGLEFSHGGNVGLSRDKVRKICNLFRYEFRRNMPRLQEYRSVAEKTRFAIHLCKRMVEEGVRSVMLIDYYLKHVEDEKAIERIDQWLIEEIAARVTGRGHKKSNLRRVPPSMMREMGLPSLVHRRRLLIHGHLDASFFTMQRDRFSSQRSHRRSSRCKPEFSRIPEATDTKNVVGKTEPSVHGSH